VTCALLDRQLDALAKAFAEQGGFTERLYRVRSAQRRKKGEWTDWTLWTGWTKALAGFTLD